MVIAQISDTHILAKSSGEPLGVRRAANLRRCIADINTQEVDAVIHTGDSVHLGLAEQYAHLSEILAELEAPLYLVPGNRDQHDAIREAFEHLPYLPCHGPFLHYAIDDLPVRLVALDSVTAGERKGVFCAERLAWLGDTLAEKPDQPTILFIHHPPFDIAPYYVDGYRRKGEAADLTTLVGRHSQVVRLLCGHVHRQHHTLWAGTVAITMPSVAVDLRKGDNTSDDTAPVYLLHAVADEGSVITHTRPA